MEKVDLQEWKKNAICDILESSNTYEKVIKFEKYRSFLGKCKIFLFDEDESNLDSSFKNYEIGKCGIYGLGDYTKTWITDTCYKSNIRYVAYGKTVDFDLNVFTYLNKIMNGRNLSQLIDKRDVINYFNYIKVNEFQYGIATAMMERAAKPINSKVLIEMLVSYVKYEKINYIDERVKTVRLNIFDYVRVLKLYRMTWNQYNLEIRQLDMLCCCLMKSYLIKKYDSEKSKKKK